MGRPGDAFMPGTGLNAVKTQICHMCVGGSQRGQGRDRPPQNIPTDAEAVPLSQPLLFVPSLCSPLLSHLNLTATLRLTQISGGRQREEYGPFVAQNP